jgi:tetratricopeptide (TPR) repeat protein
MERVAHELRQPSQEWLVGVYRGMLALLEGRFAEAEELISATHERGGRAQSWNATVCFRLQLCHLRREQGRLAEVRSLARRSIDEFPTYPIWRCAWAQMAAELGETAEASGVLEGLAAERFQALPLDEEWIASVVLLADAAATLGDVANAAVLHDLLLPYADRVVMSYPEISLGAVSRYLGLAAATAGRWDDATRSFEAALRINERIGARPWVAHTRRDQARALLARGAPGDGERARALLAQARDAYRALGMDAHAARAAAA